MDDSRGRRLIRQLGGFDVFCICAGAMISSGLFVLPGLVYAGTGPAVIFAYLLAGIFVLPVLFAKAELATAMPKAGGSYFFIERSMGSVAGTIGGFASWFSLSLKSAFALVGIGAFVTLISPGITEWQIKLIAVGFCVFFTVLNLISVKFTGRVQSLLVVVLITLLVLYVFRGAMSIDVQRYTPFMPFGRRALLAAVVFVSFGGLTKAASVAEEVRNPGKDIPYGMISAFLVVLMLYLSTVFVTVGLLGEGELAHSLTPISTGGHKILGAAGRAAMAFAAILAFVSTANAGILAASRFPLAMSRDRLLPRFLASTNRRFKTPHSSILCTGAFMITVILLLDLESLVKLASTMKIILFAFVLIACIIMRESRILNYKPVFVSPLYPWLHILGIICYGFLLYQMGGAVLLTAVGFVLASVLWHRLYVRGGAMRKSALVHIVERITAKEIAGDSLRAELSAVLSERDELIEDRFHKLVQRCEIIDIDKPITLTEFFTIVAEKLADRLHTDPDRLLDSFIQREQDTTTVIRPGLAIPHTTIDGEHQFELLMARCAPGVDFAETSPPVYAAFVMAGTRDERNFHLRVLSAIAQVAHAENFDRDWLRAGNIEDLRDIVLLAQRRRERG